MNSLKNIFQKYGFTCLSAAKKGVNYQTLYKQMQGKRTVGAKTAMRYHKILGIPLHELRPDLWEAGASAPVEDPPPERTHEEKTE